MLLAMGCKLADVAVEAVAEWLILFKSLISFQKLFISLASVSFFHKKNSTMSIYVQDLNGNEQKSTSDQNKNK